MCRPNIVARKMCKNSNFIFLVKSYFYAKYVYISFVQYEVVLCSCCAYFSASRAVCSMNTSSIITCVGVQTKFAMKLGKFSHYISS